MTINERLIPDEISTADGDPVLGGTLSAKNIQQHSIQQHSSSSNDTSSIPNATPDSVSSQFSPSHMHHESSCDDTPLQKLHPSTPMDIVTDYQAVLREKLASPGSILDLRMRPPSPTNLCDFPYYDIQDDECKQQHLSLPLSVKTTTILPRFKNDPDFSHDYLSTPSINNDTEPRIEHCERYHVIADLGLSHRAFIASKSSARPSHLADTGANCCMTPDMALLQSVETLLEPITVGVAIVGTHDPTYSQCTHIGFLPVLCDDGSHILTKCFYNPCASDTIISPQAIVDMSDEFHSWQQTGRKYGLPGTLEFLGYSHNQSITLRQHNGLYYCSAGIHPILKETPATCALPHELDLPGIQANRLSSKRVPPPSSVFKPTSKAKILESETWYLRLGACNETQLDKLPQHAVGLPSKLEWHPFRFVDFKEQARIRKRPVGRNPVKVSKRGQRFYMDFGFIRASAADLSQPKSSDDRVVESFDGFNSYLLIVDEVSKYSWIFLTKSKEPPVELTQLFMKEFANADGGKIRVDQGGELARSTFWRTTMLTEFQYKVEPTGADSPSQNGQVERYNETVATIVRTLLYGSHLPAKFWSVAAVHAVYLMNRRVHSSIGITPYEAWWDELPDLSLLKVFGSRVCVKVTGKRRAKLDRHDFSGIFIGYTATDDNIRYIDTTSGIVKTSHHAVFDEAWYLQPHRPPAAQLLYDMGMEHEDCFQCAPPSQPRPAAPYPSIPTKKPTATPTMALNSFLPLRLSETPTTTAARAAKVENPYEDTILHPRYHKLDIIQEMNLDRDDTFAQIYISPSPYCEAFEETLDLRKWTPRDHQTAGLVLQQKGDRLILISIDKSTPASRIPRWRSRCRGAWIMEINGIPVSSSLDVITTLNNCKRRHQEQCKITLSHSQIKEGLTSEGIPQVNIDQFNPRFIMNVDHIIRQEPELIRDSGGVFQYSSSKLTRGKLMRQDDWSDWQEAEWLQLDQYYSQLLFGSPTKVTDRNNVFHLVWSYSIKDLDGRKKARCTCDGSTRGGKVRVLDYTHANCVDHTASRLFYAISAAENYQIFGGDVSNAFGEAPPPKQGFFIQPDQAFRDWWLARGYGTLDADDVIPVMRAMQGHPESSRLWEKHCDKFIRAIGFTPTTHEPCLYIGVIDGQKCIFKRQVDDFALACKTEETANKFYDMIDEHLSMPIKRMGLVTLFNGIDVLQSRYYIKISCETYIEKFCMKYLLTWLKDTPISARPTPMPTTKSFLDGFQTAQGDPDDKIQEKLKKQYGFGYRNGIGELIYAMVTCRPDISTTVVRCAQHSACPAEQHFHAVRHAIKYLYVTRSDGIYFWRKEPLMHLPEHPIPDVDTKLHGQIPTDVSRPQHDPLNAHAYVDSDWATCTRTRRSMTGVTIKLAGGTIAYKTKLQPTVALSSTEAEFMAACDAGKMILFVRSIMWDLDIPQQAASILYEDNDAATAMANAQKPTTRTRHMDIRFFALADWVERDLIVLERIHTSINEADHLTKSLERTLFYRHVDHIMGHIPPAYSPCYQQSTGKSFNLPSPDLTPDELVWSEPAASAAKCSVDNCPWVHIVMSAIMTVQSIPDVIPQWIVGGC
jgi:hypothetical protein